MRQLRLKVRMLRGDSRLECSPGSMDDQEKRNMKKTSYG
jgi:hypothetical protein